MKGTDPHWEPGDQPPVRVGSGVVHPDAKFGDAFRVGAVCVIGGDGGGDDDDRRDGDHEEAF